MSNTNSTLETTTPDTWQLEKLERAEKAALGIVSIARVLQRNLVDQDCQQGEPFSNFIAGGLLDAVEALGWEQSSTFSLLIEQAGGAK